MNFHNIRLPKFIEILSTCSTEFNTYCINTISGRETRRQNKEYARQKYIIKNPIFNMNEFEQFNNFFKARRGRQYSFRLRDHFDYNVENQFIASGDDISQEFQLIKLYDDKVAPYSRRITKIVEDTCNLSINDMKINANIDYVTGIVKLSEVLQKNQILKANFMFDVEVRFASDNFEYIEKADSSFELSDIILLEIL
jgi:uncharacterized protein (TIGR02217 family)